MKKDYADYLLKYSQKVYDNIAVEFSKTRQGFWSDLNFLLEYIKDGYKVLDLGCGNGRLLNVLKDKKIDYIGIDNSERLLWEAQRQYPEFKERFWKADALNLPFSDNEFDIVISIAVLQHIPSRMYRMKFLKECLRVLKKDGKILLTVWLIKNKSFSIINIFKSIGRVSKMDFNDLMIPFKIGNQNLGDRYVHAFSLRELVKLFKESGFKIEQRGYTVDLKNTKKNIYIVASKY